MKDKMLKIIAGGLSAVGIIAAGASSMGCLVIVLDEPEAPASLIER